MIALFGDRYNVKMVGSSLEKRQLNYAIYF